jgi:hypothetical protein
LETAFESVNSGTKVRLQPAEKFALKMEEKEFLLRLTAVRDQKQ